MVKNYIQHDINERRSLCLASSHSGFTYITLHLQYMWLRPRVTRFVCEKMAQKVEQPIFCQNLYTAFYTEM
jgi:hypothetical protein